MNDNGQKKPNSRAGCVVGIAAVFLMLIGLVLIVWSGRSEEHSQGFIIAGIAFFMLPLLLIPAMTLIPQKVRGVNEVPKKERIFQNLLITSFLMAIGGFLGAIAACYIEMIPLAVVFGIIAAVGFITASIVSAVHTRVTGKQGMTIELFPTDPEQDARDREAVSGVINKVLKKEEGLSAEERERELQRIEQQDRITGSGMTKEQVEEYENRKRGG